MEKEEFLKLLPKLIREDNEVKGAILTALSGVVATKEDVTRIIEHSDKRFEAVQDQMDKRFDAMQDQMDKRFEAIITQMNKGFEDARQDREKLHVQIATVSSRGGEEFQDTVLNLLKDKLIQESIPISDIKRETIVDREGNIFYKDYNTDIDLLIKNEQIILIEIKFKADNRDVYVLIKKGDLYNLLNEKKYDQLMLVCLEINKTNFEQAIKQGIKVITGKII